MENRKLDIANLVQIFNYQEYLDFMESKKVRQNENRTNTLLDFVTDEEVKQDKIKGIFDLSKYDPTPKEINEHFEFINKTLFDLKKSYPNDEVLNSLLNDENMQEVRCSYNWYEQYGITK